jgi:hypothetical protein
MAIAGFILGVVSLIVAGIVTAGVSAAAKSIDESINAEHTVQYVVTTSGPASISYWTPGGTSTEHKRKLLEVCASIAVLATPAGLSFLNSASDKFSLLSVF